jgi:hypothetical protein
MRFLQIPMFVEEKVQRLIVPSSSAKNNASGKCTKYKHRQLQNLWRQYNPLTLIGCNMWFSGHSVCIKAYCCDCLPLHHYVSWSGSPSLHYQISWAWLGCSLQINIYKQNIKTMINGWWRASWKGIELLFAIPISWIIFRKVNLASSVIIKSMIYIHINFVPQRTSLQKVLWWD